MTFSLTKTLMTLNDMTLNDPKGFSIKRKFFTEKYLVNC